MLGKNTCVLEMLEAACTGMLAELLAQVQSILVLPPLIQTEDLAEDIKVKVLLC